MKELFGGASKVLVLKRPCTQRCIYAEHTYLQVSMANVGRNLASHYSEDIVHCTPANSIEHRATYKFEIPVVTTRIAHPSQLIR